MSKPDTNLANLIPARTNPRSPSVSDETPKRQRQPGRAKTVMIAGHFDADVSFAMHELCGKLTRQRGERFTVQQALAEALTDWFNKNGAIPPEGLSKPHD